MTQCRYHLEVLKDTHTQTHTKTLTFRLLLTNRPTTCQKNFRCNGCADVTDLQNSFTHVSSSEQKTGLDNLIARGDYKTFPRTLNPLLHFEMLNFTFHKKLLDNAILVVNSNYISHVNFLHKTLNGVTLSMSRCKHLPFITLFYQKQHFKINVSTDTIIRNMHNQVNLVHLIVKSMQ